MNNEEKEYQKFLEKTLKACRELDKDYRSLSSQNKERFQRELYTMTEFQSLVGLFQFLQK